MKLLFLVCALSLLVPFPANAVQHSCNPTECSTQVSTPAPGKYEKGSLRKPNFIERFAIRLAQKGIVKKIAKGDLLLTASQDDTGAGNPNKRGLVSLLFALVGILFLFIPGGLAGIGGLFAIAGFILGIIGLKRDEDKTLALIGTIVGALVVTLYLLVIYT